MKSVRLRFLLITLSVCAFGVMVLTNDSGGEVSLVPELLSTGLLSFDWVEGERSFSFTADPSLRLLHVQYVGGSIVYSTSYSLYADGRLVIQLSDPGGKRRVLNTYERKLSYEETEALVGLVVYAGFIESSREHIHELMKAAQGPALPRGSDSPDMVLTVNLESYLGPGMTALSPATNKIVLHNPSVYSERYPEIPEIQSLATLQKVLHQYFKAAKKENP